MGGEALKLANIHAVGIANNVNYGAGNIAASIARLDEIGVLHTGAGPNLVAARAPAILERHDLRVGFLQRSSVYWSAFRRPTGQASRLRSSPGRTQIISRTSATTSRRFARRSTSWLPRATGGSGASRCNT